MTGGAGIGDSELLGQARRDESESVAAYIVVPERLRNFRHMASSAFAARAFGSVMGMLIDRSLQSCRIRASVTTETKRIAGDDEIGSIGIAVNLVAIEASHAAVVHGALDKIIPLHAIFVR